MVCLWNICINTLHKGDNDDDDYDNNNNNNNNNRDNLYHLKIIRTTPEQHTGKARYQNYKKYLTCKITVHKET
jgi:hypothetical protein